MSQELYPLLHVKIGDTFKNGSFTNHNCIGKPITAFAKGDSIHTYMSGTSKFIRTEDMNKGSLGVSGSYGISGVAKFSAAVSGYYGKAASRSGKSIEINQNILAISGKEFLNIDELNLTTLIEGLSSNVKNDLLKVLDKFNELKAKLDHANIDVKSVLAQNEKYEAWAESLENFFENHGDGFVAAVHWGAFGHVKLTISSKETGSQSNRGANLESSYQGLGGGVTVKGAYSGSDSSDEANITVSHTSDTTGSYVRPVIDKWNEMLGNIALDEISNFQFSEMKSDVAPIAERTPKIPDAVVPDADGKIMDKLGKIKDLDGLEAFAKAQAYSKAAKAYARKNNGKTLSLEQFRQEEAARTNQEFLDEITDDLNGVEINSVLAQRAKENESLAESQENQVTTHKPNKSKDVGKVYRPTTPEGYVAIGASLVNWSDLFPWLVRGIDNRLIDRDGPMQILQWRTMIQDAQALANMYYTADSIFLRMPDRSSPSNIADSFKQMQFHLTDHYTKNRNFAEAMRFSIQKLSSVQRIIYDVWCKAKVLRGAELGLGYVSYDKRKKTLVGTEPNLVHTGFRELFAPVYWPCSFEIDKKNFNEFNKSMKLYPIILTDGRIAAYCSKGYYGFSKYFEKSSPGNEKEIGSEGFCKYEFELDHRANESSGATEISHSFKVMSLEVNPDKTGFDFPNLNTGLYPIPLSAAEGIEWKGQSSGIVSLNSFRELKQNLQQLQSDLSGRNNFSYSSEHFNTKTWKPDQPLTSIKIPEYYVGIKPEYKDGLKIFS